VFQSLGLGLIFPKSEIPIYPEIKYDVSTIKQTKEKQFCYVNE